MDRELVAGRYLAVLRYVGATPLILLSAGGLIGGLLGSEVTTPGRVARLAFGLGMPWIAARLLPTRRSYWSRLTLSYLCAVVAAVLAFFLVPALLMILMDSGVI